MVVTTYNRTPDQRERKMTLFKVLAVILSAIIIIVMYLIPTSNDSLEGVFTAGNITQSTRESLVGKLTTLLGWSLIIIWAIICYLAWL